MLWIIIGGTDCIVWFFSWKRWNELILSNQYTKYPPPPSKKPQAKMDWSTLAILWRFVRLKNVNVFPPQTINCTQACLLVSASNRVVYRPQVGCTTPFGIPTTFQCTFGHLLLRLPVTWSMMASTFQRTTCMRTTQSLDQSFVRAARGRQVEPFPVSDRSSALNAEERVNI